MVGDGRMKRKYAENEVGLTAMEWVCCLVFVTENVYGRVNELWKNGCLFIGEMGEHGS